MKARSLKIDVRCGVKRLTARARNREYQAKTHTEKINKNNKTRRLSACFVCFKCCFGYFLKIVFFDAKPEFISKFVVVLQDLYQSVDSVKVVLVEVVDCDTSLLVVAHKFYFGCENALHIAHEFFEFERKSFGISRT